MKSQMRLIKSALAYCPEHELTPPIKRAADIPLVLE